MELANEILEDEPNAPILSSASMYAERDRDQMYARVWCEFSKLEQIVRDNLWPVRVLKGERKKNER